MILFVGTIGILIPGVQPVVLAALLAEQHITLTQLGHAASAELLSMGLAAAFAAAFLPPRRLPAIALITSLVLAAGNWLTGFTGGILIWMAACMIARSAAPDRWAGIYLTVQTLTQLLFVAAMSVWAEPKWGARGDFALLAFAGLAGGAASLLLPRAFVPLPKVGGSPAGGLPPPLGVAGLVVNFLLMMFIVSIWVYYDPIAREAGLSSKVSDTAVQVSLGFQVLGGAAATLFAGRLRWYPTLVACTLVDLAMVWVLGTRPTASGFLTDAAIF